MKETSVIIIGAGAAGLSCALYLSRAQVPFLLLEKGAPGGKLLTIAKIENYPGLPEKSGTDVALDILASAARSGVEVGYGDVQAVSLEQDGRFLVSCADEAYRAKAVVVATGLSNVPTLPGEKALLGKGISYCATCDGPLYHGKTAVLYGSGDRALEEALYLANVVKDLFVLTPDESYHGSPRLLEELLAKANVQLLLGAKIDQVVGTSRVEKVLYHCHGEAKEIATPVLFPLFGEKSASSFLSPLSLSMDHGFILVNAEMMSSQPGLFAAGDIVAKKLRQVVTACSDGAVASSGVIAYLRGLPHE